MAANMAEDPDPKTALNHLCQRCAQRPVTKNDIVYTVNKFGQLYQAIVTLNCVGGEQYAGESKMTPKEAEKAAAEQAVAAHAATLANLPPPISKDARHAERKAALAEKRERRANQGEEGVEDIDDANNPAITPKVKLNTLCMKLAQTYLKKGETIYECRQVVGGFQATVKLACLPGDWSGRVWAGEVSSSKQKAEQSAAAVALSQITGDDDLSKLASESQKGFKGKAMMKGMGKGFLKGGKGFKGFLDWAWQRGKGKGGMSGPDLPRERITEEPSTGEVVEWKEKYGWIKPHTLPDHPASEARNGMVYCSCQDIEGYTEGDDASAVLTKGQVVRFHIYIDPSGLGAEEVARQ